MIGVLIEDKEFVDSCMGGKPWKAGNFSESLPYTMSYEERWCPLITQLISLCACNHPQMLSREFMTSGA
ncbi:Phospholipase D zeta 1 [Camellia lanceoleosa]|uniref:Phospholipase D zeta 1 n=1 Tax=Camellia lanceoleosa TaxID=1840588 RepID=A0ACC0IWY9_9ERIC|nr:Phospholipase D zeta 1 [Camellia lanceoleosa]